MTLVFIRKLNIVMITYILYYIAFVPVEVVWTENNQTEQSRIKIVVVDQFFYHELIALQVPVFLREEYWYNFRYMSEYSVHTVFTKRCGSEPTSEIWCND
jgi:hypothetical protein